MARDAEVLAQRYEQELDRLPSELVRGPVRERLVEGAQRRYQTGLRRSLIAMRSQRYFRLLDALDALVADSPVTASGEEAPTVTIDAAYKKVRKAAKAAAQAEKAAQADESDEATTPTSRMPKSRLLTRRCIGFASAPSDFAIPPQPPVTTKCPSKRRPSRRCSVIIKTAWSAANICFSRPTPRMPRARTPSPTVCSTSKRPNWPTAPANSSTKRCANSTSRCVTLDAGAGVRAGRGGRVGL